MKETKFDTGTRVIEVTNHELYTSYSTCMFDLIADGLIPDSAAEMGQDLAAIAKGDIKGIRELFTSGETCMLMPHHMHIIDDPEFEGDIRIEVKDSRTKKVILVLVDSEIAY